MSSKDDLSLGQSLVLHVIQYELSGPLLWAMAACFPLPGQLSLYLYLALALLALIDQLEQLIPCARAPVRR